MTHVNNRITGVFRALHRCADHEKGTAWTQPYGERSNPMTQVHIVDPYYHPARLGVAGIYANIHTRAVIQPASLRGRA